MTSGCRVVTTKWHYYTGWTLGHDIKVQVGHYDMTSGCKVDTDMTKVQGGHNDMTSVCMVDTMT